MARAIITLISLISIPIGTTMGGWEPTSGTFGADIRSLHVGSTGVFAGAKGGGFFVSVNDGETWTSRSGLPPNDVNGIVEIGQKILVACYNAGIFSSTNDGISWQASSIGLSSLKVEDLVIHAGAVYVSAWANDTTGGVFKSTNDGQTWLNVSTGITERRVYTLFSSQSTLYVTATTGKVFRTTDNGTTWSSISSGLPFRDIRSIASKGSFLFAGSFIDGVFRSVNGGASWTALNSGLGNQNVHRILSLGSGVLLGTENGVFQLSADESSWNNISEGVVDSSLALEVSGSFLLSGNSVNGVWRRPLTDILGEPPSISSFAPTSGTVGTIVTVSGTGFGTSPIVYAGPVRCSVLMSSPTSATIRIPAGANHSPLSVTSDNLTGFSKHPFVVTFPTSDVIDQPSFVVQGSLPSGESPFGISLGDLNGDGRPDIATSNHDANSPSVGEGFDVYENQGSAGGPIVFGSRQNLSFGKVTRMVGLSDFDRDGWLDIAVCNYRNNTDTTVSIYRNKGLGGTITPASFEAQVEFRAGRDPREMVIADFNGDGRPDIAVSNIYSKTVTVLRNIHSTGPFSPSSFDTIKVYSGADTTLGLAAGDMNNDGKVDLIIGNADLGDDSVRVLRNNGTGSVISFHPVVAVQTGGRSDGVTAGDVDGDGKLDLLVANQLIAVMSIHRNISTDGGPIQFSPYITLPVTSPRSISLGDMDGDGKPDLCVTSMISGPIDSLLVFKNKSSPGILLFASRTAFPAGDGARTLGVGDLNLDGKPDILIANRTSSTITIARNSIRQPAEITSILPPAANVGAVVSIQGRRFNNVPMNNTVYFGATKGQVVTASDSVLTVAVPSGASFSPIQITKDALTTSGPSFDVTFSSGGIFDTMSLSPQDPITVQAPRQSLPADMNGDGLPDLVSFSTGSGSISVLRNMSVLDSILFAIPFDSAVGLTPEGMATGDLDGDRRLDVVVMNTGSRTASIFLNNSTTASISLGPRFDMQITNNTNARPRDVQIADFDGDGRPDLFVSMQVLLANDSVLVLRNIGSPGNPLFEIAWRFGFPGQSFPRGLSVVDLDGDRRVDVCIAAWDLGATLVLRNTGAPGSISFAAPQAFSTGTNPLSVALGDLDADGRPDLVTGNFNSGTIATHRNTSSPGSIGFSPGPTLLTATQPVVSLSDMNGDGSPDVVAACVGSERLQVFVNRGGLFDSLFASPVEFVDASQLGGAALADFNGDGKPDVVTSNELIGSLSLFRNTVGGQLNAAFQANPEVISFGAIAVGSTDSATIVVTNVGGDTLDVSFVGVQPPQGYTIVPSSASILPSDSRNFLVKFAPPAASTFVAKAVFQHNGSPQQDTIDLSGSGLATGFGLSSSSLEFGNVAIGDTLRDTVSVINSSTVTTLVISSITATNQAYSISPVSFILPPQGTQNVSLAFAPRVTGDQIGNLIFEHNAVGSPDSLGVSGTGVAPIFAVSNRDITFGNVVVGQTGSNTIQISNPGTDTLDISVESPDSLFSIDTTNVRIVQGQSHSFNISFSPSGTGLRSGSFLFSHNAGALPDTIRVTGTGVTSGILANPTSLNFGNLLVGTNAVDTIEITNIGGDTLTIVSIQSSDPRFTILTSAPIAIVGGGVALCRVGFAPDSARQFSGSVRFRFGPDSADVQVSGNGVVAGLLVNPSSISFNQVSAGFLGVQSVLVQNTGGAVLSLNASIQDPSFSVAPTDTTIPAGSSVQLAVWFVPTVSAEYSAALFLDAGLSGRDTVGLQGVGIEPTPAAIPNTIAFGQVNIGDLWDTTIVVVNLPFEGGLLRVDSVVTADRTNFQAVSISDTLGPNQQVVLDCAFSPQTVGNLSTDLLVFYNGSKPLTVGLSGVGVRPNINVPIVSYSFDPTFVGESSARSDVIIQNQNIGTFLGPLIIQSVISTNPSVFAGVPQAFVIPPGEARFLMMSFTPESAISYAETLTIISNDPDNDSIAVFVGGTGRILAVPNLGSPNDGATGVSPPVNFSWSASPDAGGYELQLSTTSSFADTIVSQATTGLSAVIDSLPYNSTLFWRVSATLRQIKSTFSATRSFRTQSTIAYSNTLVHSFGTPTSSQDYIMVSFPGVSSFTPGDLLTGNRLTDWRIWEDVGGTPPNHLTELTTGSALKSGAGYWLVRTGDFIFSKTVTLPSVDINGEVRIDLRNGWNIIGNPFEVAVSWPRILTRNGIATATLSLYNRGFISSNVLAPFVGYYFNNTANLDSLIVPYPFPLQEPDQLQPPIEWSLRLGLHTDGIDDRENRLGISAIAAVGRDVLDDQKPPMFDDQPFILFDRPEWDNNGSAFAADFRPELGEGQVWEFTVNNPHRTPATIRVEGIGTLPPHLEVKLIDLHNTTPLDLREHNIYSFLSVSTQMEFRVLVGSRDFVRQRVQDFVPREFSLEQNFPNPFNPTTSLEFRLPQDAIIRLDVFSMLGEYIATVAKGNFAAGTHTVLWNGHNEKGEAVSSGMYLYRLDIDGRVLTTRKMVLLK